MSKSGKGNRKCGVCGNFGHNSRTCTVKKSDDSVVSMDLSRSEETVPHAERPKASEEGALSLSTPASFEEQRLQTHFDGQTMIVSARDYANGATTVTIRHAGQPNGSKELHMDMPAASQLLQMLTTLIQRHVVSQTQKEKPLARATSNGLGSQAPSTEIQPS